MTTIEVLITATFYVALITLGTVIDSVYPNHDGAIFLLVLIGMIVPIVLLAIHNN